jgi:hypothetical protein
LPTPEPLAGEARGLIAACVRRVGNRYELRLDTLASRALESWATWVTVRTFDLGLVADTEVVNSNCGLHPDSTSSLYIGITPLTDREDPPVIRGWRIGASDLALHPIPRDSLICINELVD